MSEEATRLLTTMGAEVPFNPSGLPLPDDDTPGGGQAARAGNGANGESRQADALSRTTHRIC